MMSTAPAVPETPVGSANIVPASPVTEAEIAFYRRRVLSVSHALNYRYPSSVRNVNTRLRLLPPPVRGGQRLLDSRFRSAPLPAKSREYTDDFGNRVREVHHETVWENLTLISEIEVECQCAYDVDGRLAHQPLPLSAEKMTEEQVKKTYLPFTRLTTPNAGMEEAAQETLREHRRIHEENESGDAECAPEELAFALCQRVYRQMTYTPGSTAVTTTGAEAWKTGRGVCQDYAHILIALCRSVNLPARYVSGFLPGEGAMHAWVETLVPGADGVHEGGWLALDPTHDRWVNERYVTIGAGRDYADITPTSGSYFGKGKGILSHRSRVQILSTVEVRADACKPPQTPPQAHNPNQP